MFAIIMDFAERIHYFIGQPVTTREIIFDYYLPFGGATIILSLGAQKLKTNSTLLI